MCNWHDDQRRMTEKVDQLLNSFTCSNGNHRARGEIVIVNRRKLCTTCAAARRAEIKKLKQPRANIKIGSAA